MIRRTHTIALLCFLAGCAFEPTGAAPPGSGAQNGVVPSSGARADHLDGVTAGLTVPATRILNLDTDTGAMVLFDAPAAIAGASADPGDLGQRWRMAVLPAGETVLRRAGEGVVDGIGFHIVDDQVAVLAVTSLTIEPDAALFPIGTRALVVLSEGEVSIQGVFDVSAPCDGTTRICGGPGGGDGAETQGDLATGCAPGRNGNGSFSGGRTGGGGGGFSTDGAAGGTAGGGTVPGGAGGSLELGDCPGSSLEPLIGGGGGGAGAYLAEGGSGGGGGGALQITSFTSITINPPASSFFLGIFANGAGGDGASDGGGGGGGAGGAILLEAPAITVDGGYIVANGGAGGAGGMAGSVNNPGENGQFNGEVALGGTGQFPGGNGGTGDDAPQLGLGGGDSTGGGGGSAGIIHLHVPPDKLVIDGARFSPQPIISPL
jgi:hypothetical protein